MEETFSVLIGVGAILFWWIVLAFASRRKLGSGMSTLVLRRFVLPDDSESDVLVCIVGCKSGVMGWLMTVAGISTETTLRVSKKDILFRDASLSGSSDSLLTLKGGVASVHCAIHKPIGFIILAILFVVAGVCWYVFASDGTLGAILAGVLLGGLMLVFYRYNKRFCIKVQSTGGAIFGMNFRASQIEGVSVGIDRVCQAVDRINAQIVLLQSE
ncbi:MAG TPA: hypothetical protein IAA13_00220 [Candidatus Alistipes merdigallinarum]|nr:hypothetical protein [Candidatus Alistipes merdigallinarum]